MWAGNEIIKRYHTLDAREKRSFRYQTLRPWQKIEFLQARNIWAIIGGQKYEEAETTTYVGVQEKE